MQAPITLSSHQSISPRHHVFTVPFIQGPDCSRSMQRQVRNGPCLPMCTSYVPMLASKQHMMCQPIDRFSKQQVPSTAPDSDGIRCKIVEDLLDVLLQQSHQVGLLH